MSYSLNEKLFHFDNFDCEYLCVGSSMALNNINSDEMVAGISSEKYFNFASWGVRMSDIYTLLKVYLREYKPKFIILASNAMDFYPSLQFLSEDQIKQRILYPANYLTPYYYLAHFDLQYYYKYYWLNKTYKFIDTISESIKFDKYGGVPLVAHELPEINSQFWNDTIEFTSITEKNYDYLDSISKLISSKNINFIFIQTPLREGLIDDVYKVYMKEHVKEVSDILKKYNFQVIDATEIIWPDTMFFDYGHFNKRGARIFTRYCVNKMNEHNHQNQSENSISNVRSSSVNSQTTPEIINRLP